MTRKEIIKKTYLWQEKLGLSNWDIEITFDQLDSRRVDDGVYVGTACTNTNVSYMQATLNFQKNSLHLIDESVIVHELLHIVMAEMDGYYHSNIEGNEKNEKWHNYFQERTVSTLERIVLRVAKKAR